MKLLLPFAFSLLFFCVTSEAQIVHAIAESGITGYSGDGGPASSAQFDGTRGIAVDKWGNIYIADERNNRIRKITKSGMITTIAGSGAAGYSGDGGAATAAQLNHPYSVAVDRTGNIYIADAFNNRIRKVTPLNKICTIAGNGLGAEIDNSDNTGGFSGDGGAATKAGLHFPSGVAVDKAGNIYIADDYNNRIRKVTPSGKISTIAGNGSDVDNGDNIGDGGAAKLAQLDHPVGVAVDKVGNVYIADMDNFRIRKVNTAGRISTVAGNGTYGRTGDGGVATAAQLSGVSDLTVDEKGNVYFSDWSNNRIRRVTPMGKISTAVEHFTHPNAIEVDSLNNLYVTNETDIFRIENIGSDAISKNKISGIGFLKLGEKRENILDTLLKVVGSVRETPVINKMDELSVFFDRKEGAYQTDDTLCPLSQTYIVYELKISGISFRKLHLIFYNDNLVAIKCDGSQEIENAINLKYGEEQPEITTKKVTCSYKFTGASYEVEELQAITTWRDDSIICQDDLNSYYDDKCEKQVWHYFTLEMKDYQRKIWDCEKIGKAKNDDEYKKTLDKF